MTDEDTLAKAYELVKAIRNRTDADAAHLVYSSLKAATPCQSCESLVKALEYYINLPDMTFPHSDGINRIFFSGKHATKALYEHRKTGETTK